MQMNKSFANLKDSYLFSTIGKKVSDFARENPGKKVIRLGIGDVTRPLSPACVQAMHKAVDEMANGPSFRGYGPEQGYDFLREKIQNYYRARGIGLSPDEIFVGDGAKSDVGNILDLFGQESTVLIPDPVYPVYVDTNIMGGRPIRYIDAARENDFLPMVPQNASGNIIYICSPNNPTGAVYSHSQLQEWVDFANETGAIILFDAAYEAFISGDFPRSIFETSSAKTCAIEFCSLSKTAGFTGLRCGYTVVPRELSRNGMNLGKMWLRRQTTKFNGVSYVTQRAAEAVFSGEGQKQICENISYYMENTRILASFLKERGVYFTGGENSPYIWLECPINISSWEFFDKLLQTAQIVGTPGSGFGKNGEGFFRLTGFGTREDTEEAVERLRRLKIFG